MVKHTQTITWHRLLSHIGVAFGCITAAFMIGIQSAGEVQPVGMIQAGGLELQGDFTGDGNITVEDAIVAIEIGQGYRTPTVEQLKADYNGDYVVTIEDGLAILRSLATR